MSGPETIASVEEFLAHAYTLEQESVDRYEELADVMEVHNNHDIAALFRKFAGFGRKHASEVMRLARGRHLPRLQPWEFKWLDAEGPETSNVFDVHYLMTPMHALQVALDNEQSGCDYYALIARTSVNAEVRTLAQEFAAEEAQHVSMLQRWIADTEPAAADWDEDPDPPQMPE